jgi:hypothetical protein
MRKVVTIDAVLPVLVGDRARVAITFGQRDRVGLIASFSTVGHGANTFLRYAPRRSINVALLFDMKAAASDRFLLIRSKY